MKSKIAVIATWVIYSLFSYECTKTDQEVTIYDVTRDTTIVIKDNNSFYEQELSIDVSGKLDGEAILETSHTVVDKNRPATVLTYGYYVRKRMPEFFIKEDHGLDHIIRYKSVTAKKGQLVLTIKLPADPNLANTGTDYVLQSDKH
ncbi:hypothetical protein [Fibrella arboris]|uniref:hypothetical protein n=1 Tax=Fibrella arboris TaxID=3242486 RepID=UPI003520C321